MQSKTQNLNIRIEEELKNQAGHVLEQIGLSTSDAVRMFFKQIVFQRGLPFDAKIPNAETIAAFKELESGGGEAFESAEEMFESWKNI